MSDKNIVALTFPEKSKSYQALTVLRNLDADGQINLEGAVVIERDTAGNISFPDGQDNVTGVGTASGSLVGMFVGVLGGPLGMLLGWGAGALIGGALDIDHAEDADEVIGEFSKAVPPGSSAVIAEVEEVGTATLDAAIQAIGGGVIVRRPAADVLAELEAAHDAADAANREARRVVHEQKKQQRKEKWEERLHALKEKFHRHKNH